MATYVLGDVQGCFEPMKRLLERVDYSPGNDRLWLAGDLVNRGPKSLEVLRWASQEPGLVAVLGNHDLNLLAVAAGVRRQKRRDTLDAVLGAPDRDELLGWLRQRPLLHREGPWLMVHAGLLPGWSIAAAEGYASRLEQELRGPRAALAVGGELEGELGQALAALTRLRMCTATGEADYAHAGPPATAPPGQVPWFEAPRRAWARDGVTVLFGHWAALGVHRGGDAICLDSGCVWGGQLSCLRLDDAALFQVPPKG